MIVSRRGNGTGTLFRRTPKGAWLMRWFDEEGRRRERSTRTTNRRAAECILEQVTSRVALSKSGVDPNEPPRRMYFEEGVLWTYVVCSPDFRRCKIGRSRHVRERVTSLGNQSESGVVFMFAIRGDHEPRLHQEFADYRLHGEWFRLEGAVLEFVESKMDEI